MTADTLPPLPEPWDYCYEWNGPYGTRKFSAARHNGSLPDRSTPIYREDQLRAYGRACADAAVEHLTAERDALRAALTELVALKALRDRIDSAGSLEREESYAHMRRMDDYNRRKPIAWAAVRSALGIAP